MALYTHPACGASPSSARPGSRTFAPQHSSVRNVQRGTLSQSIQHATGRRAWCAKSALPAHLPETVAGELTAHLPPAHGLHCTYRVASTQLWCLAWSAGGQRGSVRPTLYHTRKGHVRLTA